MVVHFNRSKLKFSWGQLSACDVQKFNPPTPNSNAKYQVSQLFKQMSGDESQSRMGWTEPTQSKMAIKVCRIMEKMMDYGRCTEIAAAQILPDCRDF